tara:strand:- start:562 stop:1041 length:480 start_codon:yes stop_codon:yes gene_type:complete
MILIVPGTPIAQPRQRHRVITSRNARAACQLCGLKPADRHFVSNYTPAKHAVNTYKQAITLVVKTQYSDAPMTGPLDIFVEFVMPRPAVKVWKRKPMPTYPHATKPDIDNLLKSTFDACNGLLWSDDSQIARLDTIKRVASGDESAHVLIDVRQYDERT